MCLVMLACPICPCCTTPMTLSNIAQYVLTDSLSAHLTIHILLPQHISKASLFLPCIGAIDHVSHPYRTREWEPPLGNSARLINILLVWLEIPQMFCPHNVPLNVCFWWIFVATQNGVRSPWEIVNLLLVQHLASLVLLLRGQVLYVYLSSHWN